MDWGTQIVTCTFYYLKCRCKGKVPRCKAVQPPKRVFDVDAFGCVTKEEWMECPVYTDKIEKLEKLL
jgi:hypothetical protein